MEGARVCGGYGVSGCCHNAIGATHAATAMESGEILRLSELLHWSSPSTPRQVNFGRALTSFLTH
jgi:hypothetical protein